MNNYGIKYWGNNNFIICKDLVKINYKSSPALLHIIEEISKSYSIKGPILLRFPHLITKQINTLYTNFHKAIKENNYDGTFHALFPLKVNQFPQFLKHIVNEKLPFNYGLEAGSKAELLLAMSLNSKKAPLIINGFKDQSIIDLGFLATSMGHITTLIIEGLSELQMIIKIYKSKSIVMPNIGIRMRLHSIGSGLWAKSGGITAKFGLTATEVVQAITLMKKHSIINAFSMIHFHIGSQLKDIFTLKKALREVGNIYAELIKLGATSLQDINIGGGIAIEYSQYSHKLNKNYEISEFSNDVVFELKTICDDKNVRVPNIYTESGRFIAADHALLIAPVLELFSNDYKIENLRLKKSNPPLISELNNLFYSLNEKNVIEFLHDAFDHMESLLSLFDLGYIDLIDRSNAEILTHLIIKKSLLIMKDAPFSELENLQNKLQERYLVNSSFFQCMPDFWGLKQNFPIMPIHKLNKKANRAATLWDITCDSDGEILFNSDHPLFLHDINLDKENYYLGFFLLGAYQEALSMNHNLFSHPTEVTINIDEQGFSIDFIKASKNILDVLVELGFNQKMVTTSLNDKISNSNLLTNLQKNDAIAHLNKLLIENGYLQN